MKQRYEVTQGGIYLGTLVAESSQDAVVQAATEFAEHIEALAIEGAPDLVAAIALPRFKIGYMNKHNNLVWQRSVKAESVSDAINWCMKNDPDYRSCCYSECISK